MRLMWLVGVAGRTRSAAGASLASDMLSDVPEAMPYKPPCIRDGGINYLEPYWRPQLPMLIAR